MRRDGPDVSCGYPGSPLPFFLVIVLVIEIDDFNLVLIDPERKPPVSRYRQAPRAFAVACQLMCFPGGYRFEFVFLLHVLQKEIIRRSFSATAACMPLLSSCSTKRRSPLCRMFRIRMHDF